MWRKLCSVIVAAVLCCGSAGVPAFAASGGINEAVFELSSLGVIEGDENGELNLSSLMTRAEFAKIVATLRGSETIAENFGSGGMNDVPAEHWAAGYVGYCVNAGLMQGDGAGQFRPDDNITLEECVKTIVVLLGYEVAAEEKGGYPTGYYNVAMEKDLLDGVTGAQKSPAVRQDIVLVIYNALDVPNLVSDYSAEVSYKEDPNQTLRGNLERMKDMVSYTGIVTANLDVWLIQPIDNMEGNQVEIDGYLFDSQVENAGNYIGQEVRIYYEDRDDLRYPVIYNIEPTARNTVTELDNEDIAEVTEQRLTYWTDDKERFINFASDVNFVYNNRVESSFSPAFAELTEGQTILIDNDGDNRFDYVFIEDYKNYVVENAAVNGNMKLKYQVEEDGSLSTEYTTIQLDLTQENMFAVTDEDGNRLDYEDLEPGDVVSVFENNADDFILISVKKDAVMNGQVSLAGGEKNIKISGQDQEYHVASEAVMDTLRVGDTYNFYLNFNGDIIYAAKDREAASNWKYGYINQIGQEEFDAVTIQLINAGKVENREEVDLADRTNTNTIPVTLCANESVQEIKQSGKLTIDGSRKDAAELNRYVGQPIRYTLTSDGSISRIETLELAGGNTSIQYNAEEKVFGGEGGLSSNPFMIDENTQVICAPSNAGASSADLLARITIDNKDTLLRYNAFGYELEEDTGAVELLVLTTEMDADAVTSVQQDSSKMGLIGSAALSVNEDGDEYMTLTMISGTEVEEIETLPLDSGREELRNLKSGDFIYYSEDADGNIDNVIIAQNMNEIGTPYHSSIQTLNEQAAGYVTDIRLNKIDGRNMIKVHEMDMIINSDGDTELFRIPVSNYPDIFIYDQERETVEAGTIDDIISYTAVNDDSEKVFIAMPNETIRALVIIR